MSTPARTGSLLPRTLALLRAAGVPVVVFKGLDHLQASLSGTGDLDLLTTPAAFPLLRRAGLVRDGGAEDVRAGAATVWRGFDEGARAWVMAHVHTRLLVGAGLRLRYPHEEAVLASVTWEEGVPRPAPVHEALVRMLDRSDERPGSDPYLADLCAQVADEDPVWAAAAPALFRGTAAETLVRARQGLVPPVVAGALPVASRRPSLVQRALRRALGVRRRSKVGGRVVVLGEASEGLAAAIGELVGPVAPVRRYGPLRGGLGGYLRVWLIAQLRRCVGEWGLVVGPRRQFPGGIAPSAPSEPGAPLDVAAARAVAAAMRQGER